MSQKKSFATLRAAFKLMNWGEMKRLGRELYPPWKSALWLATSWKQKLLLVVSALLLATPIDDLLMVWTGPLALADETVLGIMSMITLAIVQKSKAYIEKQIDLAYAVNELKTAQAETMAPQSSYGYGLGLQKVEVYPIPS